MGRRLFTSARHPVDMARRARGTYRRRKGRRRGTSGTYIKGRVNEALSLGTLAQFAMVSDNFDEVAEEKTLVSSIDAIWSIDQLKSPDGPIMFGVAHSDYTAAEIEAVIEATGSWKLGDKIEQELQKRLVRIIGVFASGSMSSTFQSDHTLNDGRPIKTKLNWGLSTGQTLELWAYAMGPVDTTGAVIRVEGHANLWQK